MRIHQNIQQSFITKKWITVVLIVLLFCGQVPIKASFAGNFDDCDPNFGDQIFAWVQNNAARLSFELADADYDARIFNYMLMSHDDQHRRASKINSELNKIAVEMETFEESVSAMDFDVAAIRREAHSQNLLNSLLSTRADLETLKGIYFATESLPTFEEFGEQGLHHVGRSTLLAAFR
ncbi:MAG: hypothetical protein IPP63_08305 [Chloracidobacterium sp.]|nr:hypothetical protein [Chloracidobacterium sp.]